MRKKRINNTNVTQVKRNGKVYYRARLTFPFDDELGYRPKPIDFYGDTEREAVRKRDEWQPSKTTLDKSTSFLNYVRYEFMVEQDEKVKSGKLSYEYVYLRKLRLTNFILDPEQVSLQNCHIRNVTLSNLKPSHVMQFFKAVTSLGASAQNVNRLRQDFSDMLKAIKRRIPEKPQEYLEDVEPVNQPRRLNRREVFAPEDVFAAIHDESRSIEARAFVAFLFMVQCRPSEMFALKWSDLDLRGSQVRLDKAHRRGYTGWSVTDGSKTGEKGTRTVYLPSSLVKILTTLNKERMKAGRASEWVFVTRKGLQLHRYRMKRYWPWVREQLGLPLGPKCYSLKHLGNSYAMSQGVTPEMQAAKMGHADTRMAREVYREILRAEEMQSATVFDKVTKSVNNDSKRIRNKGHK